jgi:malate dehydrogenase (oxaloacetate-decarboxylating)
MPITPSAQYSLTLRVEIDHRPGMLGKVASAIGDADGTIGAVDLVQVDGDHTIRDITVETGDASDWPRLTETVNAVPRGPSARRHRSHLPDPHGRQDRGHEPRPRQNAQDLSMAYTPGVARVCQAIYHDRDKAFQYTIKRNTVAVVSDGTAVLGMGDIGPAAAMPVMEGKAMLFKELAGVDAFPLCLDTEDPDEIVAIVKALSPTFGGINLEDISAPRCFEIEERLKSELDIPVFHDDQHGTAVVVLAALLNALKLTGRRIEDIRIVVCGLGAAGIAVSRVLLAAGAQHIIGLDSRGAVHTERSDYLDGSMPPIKRWFAETTNAERRPGGLETAIDGADLFIGLSGARVMAAEALLRMNPDPIVFAMANPTPEVAPEEAAPYVRIMATGRSDYPNQINNVLCFPGIFRGALGVRATQITEGMKTAAARAIASVVADDELSEDYIIPSVFNREVVGVVAAAVAEQARDLGAAEAGAEIAYGAIDDHRVLPSR